MLGPRQDAGVGVMRREVARPTDEIGKDHECNHDAEQRQGAEIDAEDGFQCVQGRAPAGGHVGVIAGRPVPLCCRGLRPPRRAGKKKGRHAPPFCYAGIVTADGADA
jgi:hypothetical protein